MRLRSRLLFTLWRAKDARSIWHEQYQAAHLFNLKAGRLTLLGEATFYTLQIVFSHLLPTRIRK